MNGDRRQPFDIELPDPPQRLGQNSALRVELPVETKRRPVAAAAFIRDRTGLSATPWAGTDEAHEFSFGEALLRFVNADDGGVTGEHVGGEDREAVDLRQRIAASDQLARGKGDIGADLHPRIL